MPAAWAREAEIGIEEAEVVARPLSVLLRARSGRHSRDGHSCWVGAVGRLEDHPELTAAQLNQRGTGQEAGAFESIVLRKARIEGGVEH